MDRGAARANAAMPVAQAGAAAVSQAEGIALEPVEGTEIRFSALVPAMSDFGAPIDR